MTEVIRKLWNGYQILFDEIADPRTKSMLLVAKPYQPLFILGLYLMFLFKWGPKLMKERPAYNLDKVLILYNIIQVVACAYLFINGFRVAWGWNYKWICEPVDYSVNNKTSEMIHFIYYYYLLKIIDLADTIFFVLRKKFNQISFLHVYHHAGMVLLSWGCITYLPGGHGTFIGFINCFVHVVMYTYYLLTVVSPAVKKSSWWKKYITQLQLLQFLITVIHMSTIVFKPDCEYPRWTAAVFIPQDLFMFILFLDFYIKTYIRKKPENDKIEITNNSESVNIEDENNLNRLHKKEDANLSISQITLRKRHSVGRYTRS